MRILIVEDDHALADALTQSLRQLGYATDAVDNGMTADTVLRTQHFDLLILDLGLPGLSGIEVLQNLRTHNNTLPVLILTASDSVEQRVRLLDAGADDFMSKPCSSRELEARIRALIRRTSGTGNSLLRYDTLTFDQVGRTVMVNNLPLSLSAREISLLEIFLMRVGQIINKHQIVDFLCQWGEEVTINAVEVYVYRLRKKLESSGVHIATVRGLGYYLQKTSNHSDPEHTPPANNISP